MFQTKRDVDKHVRAFLSKLQNDEEVSSIFTKADRKKRRSKEKETVAFHFFTVTFYLHIN